MTNVREMKQNGSFAVFFINKTSSKGQYLDKKATVHAWNNLIYDKWLLDEK